MSRPLQIALGAVLALLLIAAGVLAWRQSLPLPTASLPESVRPVGRQPRVVSIHLAAPAGLLASAEVRVAQGDKEHDLGAHDLTVRAASETDLEIAIDAAAAGLAEGEAELRVFVTDDQWRPRQDASVRLVAPFTVDLTPPSIEFLSATRYIKHAGAGIAAYRVKGASRSGVRCGGREFPGMAGMSGDGDVHVALYTTPYDQPAQQPQLFATDEAGNERVAPCPVNFLPVTFSRDRFELKAEFMAAKVAELTPSEDTSTPEATLASYLKINREMRAANEARIREIASSASQVQPLNAGAFVQQPNSQVFAWFPQQRDSLVGGQVVDTQWHLGLDLASRERAPVAATGAGRVVFTGDIGIYGNTVVLDHGLGLTSLYSHLSSIAVAPGQSVSRGETIGVTGKSGLAGGDHLHYATLVHGTYTNPIDWFDAGYLHDRIALPLIEAGIAAPGLTDLPSPNRGGRPTPKAAAKAEGRKRR